jgi:hypothetical protein
MQKMAGVDVYNGHRIHLGSPNVIAMEYFLVQHKAQLGGNKYPHIVQIWTEHDGGDPYMWFGIDDALVIEYSVPNIDGLKCSSSIKCQKKSDAAANSL